MAISTKKLIKIARRVASPRSKRVADKGHFVVYTTDRRRFELPLFYLKSEVFTDLFRMAEEEFGVPTDGPITLPCDSPNIFSSLEKPIFKTKNMISTKKLIKMAKKWHKIAVASRKRISWPRPVADKGHFVVYTTDGRRLIIPLEYLKSEIFMELLRLAEEEFGVTSSGPIILPCDSKFMEYATSLIQRHVSEELEKALLMSLTSCGYSSSLSHDFQDQINPQLAICSF
ncbi:Auxin-responsive protein SAUR64 [Bienertia sinuspersici]